jgi:cyclopropane fatty-acyl-phospholipid synthase-like methyltransferase
VASAVVAGLAGGRVLGVDLSRENLRVARALFAHPRVEYRQVDLTRDPVEGAFEAIVLPDVYEHVPVDARPAMHELLAGALAAGGRILLSIPSPAHQRHLRARGEGLQPVDEDVSIADLLRLAEDTHTTLSYFRQLSVFRTNDYVHAMLERDAETLRPLAPADRVPIKSWPRRGPAARGWHWFSRALGPARWAAERRRRRVERRLAWPSAVVETE